MASFDIIETSGKAYIRAWTEREYLFRLAAVPIILKIVFFFIMIGFGLDDNVIRQTLVMLPAYFAEGWMLAHVTRLIWLDQRWPVKLSGDPEADDLLITSRARGILAGMVTYVLLKMGQNALFSPVLQSQDTLEAVSASGAPQPSAAIFLLSIIGLIVLIWAVRFLFLYIPAAANESMKEYLGVFKSYVSSFYFIGAWLICYVPFVVLLTLSGEIIKMITMGNEKLAMFLVYIDYLVIDTIGIMVVTMAMAYGIRQVMYGLPSDKKGSK